LRRSRRIAASPKRNASQCWQAIAELISASLQHSQKISASEVDSCLSAAQGVGRQLVAGGHLDHDEHPITVIAADLHLCVNTVSGDGALTLEENLNFVPGAATAEKWIVYLPTPDPLGAAVAAAASGDAHLSAAEPPEPAAKASSAAALDDDALREWAGG
jgi:hypothetical protein